MSAGSTTEIKDKRVSDKRKVAFHEGELDFGLFRRDEIEKSPVPLRRESVSHPRSEFREPHNYNRLSEIVQAPGREARFVMARGDPAPPPLEFYGATGQTASIGGDVKIAPPLLAWPSPPAARRRG